jgi:hypothetical protein
MKIDNFVEDIKKNCSEILHLCVSHILNKLYDNTSDISKNDDIKHILIDYALFHRYLNDYASVIYKQHNSSVDIVYGELCNYFNIDINNQYTVEHIIKKLEKQTPSLIMSLEDKDIQMQTIRNFCDKLSGIEALDFYKNSDDETLKQRIEKLNKNISLVKKATQC